MTRALLAVCIASLAACGGPPSTGDGGGGSGGAPEPGPIGSACGADPDCLEGLTCVTQLPGGFCSQACTTLCPDDTLCVQINLSGTAYRLCLPQCDEVNVCRPAYECSPIGPRQICWPP